VFYHPSAQSWRKCSPELKINHYIVPFGRTGESFKQRSRQDCVGNCFDYDNDKPRPAVHNRETGSHPIYCWTWCFVRWFTMGKYFRITGSWPCWLVWLGLRRGLEFLLTHWRTEIVWLFNISYLAMNYWEYKIYSSQKFSSNHSQRSQTSSSMIVLRICG
jgi:hypothetical protein